MFMKVVLSLIDRVNVEHFNYLKHSMYIYDSSQFFYIIVPLFEDCLMLVITLSYVHSRHTILLLLA